MMYQMQYSTDKFFFRIEREENFNFPLHVHSAFEVIVITRGTMCITINGEKYFLKSGDAALIFPNQIHSLQCINDSEHILCIFSKKLVNHYSKSVQNFFPKSNQFLPNIKNIELLKSCNEYTPIISMKGVLYLLCGDFDTQAEYIKKQGDVHDDLISKIFEYVDENYKGECTLKTLEENMPYSYVYLSRCFKQHCGITFNVYVNNCRIGEACRLLQTTDYSILKVSSECGYSSLRSFNRNFKEIMALTPKQYLLTLNKNIISE